MDDLKKIVERLGQANNVLVTVSADPSVDQLAACIGLTLALNKMGKHTTAVFSGAIPDTIEFLKPEETIEKSADSLRDFIVSLDKSKADKLRYKVEDKVVKIFITPYRTSLSQDDLYFSQGDYNVDVVLTVGALEQRDLDQAITAHGRILHDATVVSMTNQKQRSQLGSLSWQDSRASSLSEMSARLVEQLNNKLMDGQIATAFLTGVVAETDRFRNAKTTADSMSLSADLMSAGANQQLITSQLDHRVDLRQPDKPIEPDNSKGDNKDDAMGALQVNHESDQSQARENADTEGAPTGQSDATPMAELPDMPDEADTTPKIHSVHANPDENLTPESFHEEKYVESADAKPGFNSAPVFDGSKDGSNGHEPDEDTGPTEPKLRQERTLLSHDGSEAKSVDRSESDQANSNAAAPTEPTSAAEKPETDNGSLDIPSPKPIAPPTPAINNMPPAMPSAGPMPPAGPQPSFSPPADQPKPDYLPLNSEPKPKSQSPAAQLSPASLPPQPAGASPELAAPAPSPSSGVPDHNQADIDAARSEVMKALSEQAPDNLPPLDSVGAQNLGSELHAEPTAPKPAVPEPPTPSPVAATNPSTPQEAHVPPAQPVNQPLDMPMPPAVPSAGPMPPPGPSMPPASGQLPPPPPVAQTAGSSSPPPVPPPMVPPPFQR